MENAKPLPQKLNFVGRPIYMNNRNYYVPSLSYLDFKDNYEFLAAVPDTTGPKLFEYFDRLIPIVGLALRRNYPDLTDEQLAVWLDMNTLPKAIEAIQSGSGMTAVSEGE